MRVGHASKIQGGASCFLLVVAVVAGKTARACWVFGLTPKLTETMCYCACQGIGDSTRCMMGSGSLPTGPTDWAPM